MTINIYNCGSLSKIEGRFYELSPSALQTNIYLKTKDLDSIQRSKFFVKLSLAPDTKMEFVSLVKEELQKANILKVKYYDIDNVICGSF